MLTVRTVEYKPAGATAVVVGWDVEAVDVGVLDALRRGHKPGNASHHDMSAVLYTTFENARGRLCGDALESARGRIWSVEYAAQGTEFMIVVLCSGNAGVVKKAISAVLRHASPYGTYIQYVHLCRRLGVSADKSAWQYCANSINASLKQGVRVVLCGKIKVDVDSLLLLSRKMTITDGPPGIRRVISTESTAQNSSPVSVGTGIVGIVFKKYVEYSTHRNVKLSNGRVYIPAEIVLKVPKRDQSVDAFIARIAKLEPLTPSLLYVAAREGLMSTRTLEIESTRPPVDLQQLAARLKSIVSGL